jgi:tagaturonate reductase
VKQVLQFEDADTGCLIVDDIYKYKELKLRLLNGTHTFSCGVALLAGFGLVREAMSDLKMSAFVKGLMMDDIVESIEGDKISRIEAEEFAKKVIDRFSNPFIDHKWSSISVQFTSKMKMRNVPLLIKSANRFGKVSDRMVVGFAAYLLLMDTLQEEGNNYFCGHIKDKIKLTDDFAAALHSKWQAENIDAVLAETLADQQLWGADLRQIPGFVEQLKDTIEKILRDGVIVHLN